MGEHLKHTFTRKMSVQCMGVRWGKRDEPTNALQWKDGWTFVRVGNAKKLVQN